LYVLPYGQMSLWGATVITNLISAVPWIGQDIVEFIWGGLYTDEPHCGDVMLKILLNAGISPNLGFAYDLFLIFISIICVKIAMTWRQSAGVRSLHTSEASQRLHAEDLRGKKIKLINSYFNTLRGGLRLVPAPQAKLNLFARGFSTSSSLSPSYVSGFSDGESSFQGASSSVLKKPGYKLGFQVLPVFTIQLHIKDLTLLEKIKSFFGVGLVLRTSKLFIKKIKSNSVIFSVQSLKDINLAIIPHFDKYPLLTKKRADFILFKEVMNLMNKGEHLTKEGLAKIINIKASINKGLSIQLKEQFTNVVPVQRPEVEISPLLVSNAHWLVGFAEAESCFLCLVRKNNNHTIGYQVTLSFSLVQHIRDLELMQKIKECWGLGVISIGSSYVRLTVTKKLDIDTIISLFSKYTLLGSKRLDFEDFSKIQEIINKGLHKTERGLDEIILTKSKMNSKRINDN
jgi:hypothetical protein